MTDERGHWRATAGLRRDEKTAFVAAPESLRARFCQLLPAIENNERTNAAKSGTLDADTSLCVLTRLDLAGGVTTRHTNPTAYTRDTYSRGHTQTHTNTRKALTSALLPAIENIARER